MSSCAASSILETSATGRPFRFDPTLGRVFFCFLALYVVTWGGHYTTGDGAEKVAWAKAILYRGSADIDPGPGVAYSKFGVGHSLLAMPPLLLSNAIEARIGIKCEGACYTFLFLLNGAWFLALVARFLAPH